MSNFDYAAPTSLAEATALLEGAHGTARVLAGGTDLLVQLREHLRDADLVVDVKKIPELMELSYSPQLGLRLGASVPCYRIYEHAEISVAYPALADAARIVGGWQIQSRASVGGNLCNSSPAADTIPATDRPGRAVRDRRPEGTARGSRGIVLHRTGQECASERRDPGDDRLPAARSPQRLGVRAIHSAERDGHRGRRGGVVGQA